MCFVDNLHAIHALVGVNQYLVDLLVIVVDNCGDEIHTIKVLLLPTMGMNEAPKAGARLLVQP